MSIRFCCDGCGKRLMAGDEHAGRTVKCPACGKEIEVRDGASQQAVEESSPRAGSARTRAGPTMADRLGGITLLGIGPRGLIKIALLTAVVGAVAIWLTWGEDIEVGQPRIVDMYTALNNVRHPKAIELINVTPLKGDVGRSKGVYKRSLLFGGEDSIVIIRPDPDAEYVAIPVSVTQKYLIDHGNSSGRTVRIFGNQFELAANGTRLEPIMLVTSYQDFVRVDRNASFMFGFGGVQIRDTRKPPLPSIPSGAPVVKRDSGMRVEYSDELGGRLLVVRWSDGCEAWRGAPRAEMIKATRNSKTTDVLLVFKRPQGDAQPIVLKSFGEVVATFPHTFGS